MAKKTLWQRWKGTTVANQALVVTGTLVALSSMFYTGAAIVQVCILNKSARQQAEQTNKLIAASERTATIANTSAEDARKANVEMLNKAERLTRANEDLVKAATKQAGSSQVSAKAADKSASIAYRSFIATQRPQLFVSSSELEGGTLAIGREIRLHLTLSNSGPVGAVSHFWDTTFVFDVAPFGTGLQYQHGGPAVNTLIPPTSRVEAYVSFPLPMTEVRMKAIDDGQARLYLFMRGEYRDEFGRVFPLPLCYRYEKSIPSHLALCPDELAVK
jgi:hypothetical protein